MLLCPDHVCVRALVMPMRQRGHLQSTRMACEAVVVIVRGKHADCVLGKRVSGSRMALNLWHTPFVAGVGHT